MPQERSELAPGPGVPETAISDALAARLPESDAPAPWRCTSEAVVWWARAAPQARALLPPTWPRASVLGVVGGIVRCRDSPVGAYGEVLGVVAARSGPSVFGSVAFIAVDSEASLVGGRANWGLPKGLATFDGQVSSGRSASARGADAVPWRVTATPRVLGPGVPVRLWAVLRQQLPRGSAGRSRLTGRGVARLAVVRVEVESEGPLPGWLRPGRHLGLVLETCTFTLAAPTPELS